MNTIKRHLIFIVLVLGLTAYSSFGQSKTELLKRFFTEDWSVVKTTKIKLEDQGKVIIPDLISMLESKEKLKLTNTGSLIYPGAEKFFGHGQIIDYDIDYLAIRAGWLLEDISFNNFGFSGIHQPKEEIEVHIKITFPDYYNNSSNRKKIENASSQDLRGIVFNLAIKKAKEWWKQESASFNRLNSLVEALKSYDEKRQVKALFYIRNGTTNCPGLNRDYYFDVLIKDVGRLSGSDIPRVSENAKWILMDIRQEWLELKQK